MDDFFMKDLSNDEILNNVKNHQRLCLMDLTSTSITWAINFEFLQYVSHGSPWLLAGSNGILKESPSFGALQWYFCKYFADQIEKQLSEDCCQC